MDNQGFMPEGLVAAPLGRVGAAARGAESAAIRAARTETSANQATRGIVIGKNINRANGKAAITAQEKRAEQLNSWSGRFESLLSFEGVGMLAGGALAWVASSLKLARVATVIKAVAFAPIAALKNTGTSLSGILNLPATYMKEVSTLAGEAGVESWQQSAAKKAAELSEKAVSRERMIANKTLGLREAAGNRLEQLEATKAAKAAAKAARKAAAARLQRVTAKHARTLSKAALAATTEPVGFFGRIKNVFTGTKPATDLPVPSELQSVVGKLHGGQSLTGEARALHFKELHEECESLLASKNLTGEVAERASAVMKHVHKAVSSAASMHGLESAAQGGLREMASVAGKAIGRVPLFGSIVGVGVVLGIGAKMAEHKVHNAHSKAAYDDVVSMLDGKTDCAFMEGVRNAQRTDGHTGLAKMAFGIANEAGNAAWALIPAGGGGAMIAAQMAPMVGEMFIQDNSALNTITVLRKHDAGELQLPDDQHLQAVKQLIAVLPSVANHGGVYNRLNHAIALEMIEQKMDTKAIVQMLADEAKFNAFSTEVKAKANGKLKASAANDTGAEAALPAANDHEPQVQTAHSEANTPHTASRDAAHLQDHAHKATHGHTATHSHPPHLAAGTKIMNSHHDNDVAQHEGTVEMAHKRAVG